MTDPLGVTLLLLVALGAFPILTMAYQFLAIPLHAVKNHYHLAEPYLPYVAVIIPAWNEGPVLANSVERLLSMQYPKEALRIYVVDDASTDETPEVVQRLAEKHPGHVYHLRRQQGGQGKAHTLNHGLKEILAEDWCEAVLITDADVVFSPTSLRRMTRHLADPQVGAVTAYIREGTPHPNFLTRFIGFEYILAQASSRRAQNVFGALACLAGGAQLHSRGNLETIGGAIDTTTLAEDTVTTFLTQLSGSHVVFEPYAEVFAEEPDRVSALWRQRLRWARGNVQVTKMFRRVWLRRSRTHNLGTISFALFWFSLLLLPAIMLTSTGALVTLYFYRDAFAVLAFRATWMLACCAYVFSMIMAVQIDSRVGLRSWREAIMLPGIISFLVLISAAFPGLLEEDIPSLFGITLQPETLQAWTLFTYSWVTLSMVAAWTIKIIDDTSIGRYFSPLLTYLIGYGPILCAITTDSYWREWRGTEQTWEKTEKTGRAFG